MIFGVFLLLWLLGTVRLARQCSHSLRHRRNDSVDTPELGDISIWTSQLRE